ncbi:MAG: M20 family metallo-hydrolase [Deltaproteobacteria bacterium]|nr:M20 family metallo-hydrolase [Deltaproteobacteria bacterium]
MVDMNIIYSKIDSFRDEIIEMQRELTARPALGPLNGGTGEHDKADFSKKQLVALKPDNLLEINAPDKLAANGYRPNLVATWNGAREGRNVWILSHLDIVPPGDLSLWQTDPYKMVVEGDKIIGRGVEDNQHGMVSSYFALKAIIDLNVQFSGKINLAFVADEETGSRFGLEYLVREKKELFSEDDLIIVPDGGNDEGTMIEIAEKSMLWLKFTVKGVQCHASTPEKGKNSLFAMAMLILEMGKLKEKFNVKDPVFRPEESTFEPTKVEANVPNVNTIPGRDVFYLDCRILPDYTVDDVIEEATKISKNLETSLDLQIDIEPIHRQDAAPSTPEDSPVIAILENSIERVTGLQAKPMGIGGGTVAAFFRNAGLPAAVWSTTSPTAHQPNEYCSVKNLISDAKVMSTVFLNDEKSS